jgi:hypothetical protein
MVVFFMFELEFKIPLRWRGGGAADGVVDLPKDIVTSTCISNHNKPHRQPAVDTNLCHRK